MNSAQGKWSRRKFIYNLTGAGAGLLIHPLSSWATSADIDKKIAAIVNTSIGIDTHNHIDVPLLASELPGPSIDLAGEMQKSGLSVICMTFAVDYVNLTYEGQAYQRFLTGLTAMDTLLKNNGMQRSLNLQDIQKAHKAKRPTVIQSVEGGHFLEGKIDRLEVAYTRGLRHLTLLHDHDASTPLGDIFTQKPLWGGLTKFGAEVVKACELKGILVDLSHCDDNTINGALNIATKPVIVSHTGLNTQLGTDARMAKMMMPRLISKQQAKIVADQGGVIGVWTHLAGTPEALADNIKAMVDVVGIDHVAIGTDTKLTPPYHSPSDSHGQRQDHRQEPTTNTFWGPESKRKGFYFQVVECLLKAGYNEKAIAMIGGGNYCRIFDLATRGH